MKLITPFLLLLLFIIIYLPILVISRPISPSPETPPTVPFSPFKPSIAVIVAVITALFSVTFLLLLYAKHCKNRAGSPEPDPYYYYTRNGLLPVSGRKNSGIDPVIIESLPVFRFSSLIGEKKNGLDCAVCLTRFEPDEILRLLPKCKHAFHVECVDTWLDAHSTCPLCRVRVDPEDVLLVDRVVDPDEFGPVGPAGLGDSTRRVSGRHSSAGERGKKVIINNKTTSFRRSLDGSITAVDKRKDGMLMTVDERKILEHKIIIDNNNNRNKSGAYYMERWSDVQPYDLFYLKKEMLMRRNEGRRLKGVVYGNNRGVSVQGINERSVSEITGLSRFSGGGGNEERESGVIARWMAWISHSTPPVRSGS